MTTETETIPNLVPESRSAAVVTPNTPVVCLNRSQTEFKNQLFDGELYNVPVGKFIVEHRVAKHFKRRLVVMGTRNREDFTERSHIAILGTVGGTVMHAPEHGMDMPEDCVPFTIEELQAFGEPMEALQRGEGEVRYINTSSVTSRQGFQAEGRNRNVAAFHGDEQVPVSDVVAPSDEPNAAKLDSAAAAGDGVAPRGGGAPEASIKGGSSGKTLKGVKAGLK